MMVRIKTQDGDIHVFKGTDAKEVLQHYKLDIDTHTFWVKTIAAEYIYPLESILLIKIIK